MTPDHDDPCRFVFDSLPRSDQRRWAEFYVHGLISVPGRKTIRRISDRADSGSADQCLQQFVNQSPWDWTPVRRALAHESASVLSCRSWVMTEIAFPKTGAKSVGVAEQVVPGGRRPRNCQLGLAVWLADEDAAVPVDWRLMLPLGWDDDARRTAARLPEAEQHRPRHQHVLLALDEMLGPWGLRPRPVVGDRREDPEVEALVRGLEDRGLGYALRIDRGTRVAVGPGRERRRVVRRRPAAGAEQLWLTDRPLELDDVVRCGSRVDRELARLRTRSGLDHFEGRSFRGWHHHVTLASVAHLHRLLDDRTATAHRRTG